MRAIGGFFPLEVPPTAKAERSLLDAWVNGRPYAAFHNGRSALSWLVAHSLSHRLWLPAYCCDSLVCAPDVQFYPLSDGMLSPDIKFLRQALKPGDVVLAIDYFGMPPHQEFLDFTKEFETIHWVEDRAQAADPGVSWGDFLLFSPRKLLGVAEGGMIVATNPKKALPPPPEYDRFAEYDFILPPLMRLADREEARNEQWYARFQAEENTMSVGTYPMHDLTRLILEHTDTGTMFMHRKKNYLYLSDKFSSLSLLTTLAEHAIPFGFPIRVKKRDAIAKQLAASRIFAACHWRDLPSDPNKFRYEHHLASEEITLPCDQRYVEAEMETIVRTLSRILA